MIMRLSFPSPLSLSLLFPRSPSLSHSLHLSSRLSHPYSPSCIMCLRRLSSARLSKYFFIDQHDILKRTETQLVGGASCVMILIPYGWLVCGENISNGTSSTTVAQSNAFTCIYECSAADLIGVSGIKGVNNTSIGLDYIRSQLLI